ncbi:response regulator transcription factor [Asticcacaulis excentricus]|uniref:Response regulator receiver protein n=1 Tax=Asticcacaulis excentricus (strain ATCC 15261 / DSM 4724 / KCTC 12464 / NCIMB 9791 / VKM B-1370 / CB 48) TaxID=573065 RepID=E8RQY1_ASTEC|nr:response regulator [Asticcacaulis excentricus]ADU12244.1 response regulator receiver protein [Asticcacaulis excentricus CB 48]
MPKGLVAIVDDDEMVRMATASLLNSFGIFTLHFASARQFLEANRKNIACLITDIQMPDMSGLDLLRVLRQARDRLPVILITAFATPTLLTQIEPLETAGLLEKPLDGDKLIALVLAALDEGKEQP